MSALRKAFLLVSICCIAIDYVASRRYTERDDYFGAIVGDNDMMDDYYDIAYYDEMKSGDQKKVGSQKKTKVGGQKKPKQKPDPLKKSKSTTNLEPEKPKKPQKPPPTIKRSKTTKNVNPPPNNGGKKKGDTTKPKPQPPPPKITKSQSTRNVAPPSPPGTLKKSKSTNDVHLQHVTKKQMKKLDDKKQELKGMQHVLTENNEKQLKRMEEGIKGIKRAVKVGKKVDEAIQKAQHKEKEMLKTPLSSTSTGNLLQSVGTLSEKEKQLKKEASKALVKGKLPFTADQLKLQRANLKPMEKKQKDKLTKAGEKQKDEKSVLKQKYEAFKNKFRWKNKKSSQSTPNLPTQSKPKSQQLKTSKSAKDVTTKKTKTTKKKKDKKKKGFGAQQSYLNDLIDQYYYDQELALRILAKERRQIQRIKQQQHYDDDDFYYY